MSEPAGGSGGPSSREVAAWASAALRRKTEYIIVQIPAPSSASAEAGAPPPPALECTARPRLADRAAIERTLRRVAKFILIGIV